MSGHSKWSTIKRKKGALDAKRGKIFTRLGRDITISVREGGGPNPDSNVRLRLAILKARASNMPKDNIDRAIARGSGMGEDGVVMEEVTYEGFGPGGVAFLVDVLTDNTNRSASNVRAAFNRANNSMGAVAWQFKRKGYIELSAQGADPDAVFMTAADAGADDVIPNDETIEVYTPRELLSKVESALAEAGYQVTDSSLTWVADNEVEIETDAALQVMNFVEKLEELDDVQSVSHNLKMTDALAAALEAASA
jgi:YebC/PmpR family DNA-binding regulatory protein